MMRAFAAIATSTVLVACAAAPPAPANVAPRAPATKAPAAATAPAASAAAEPTHMSESPARGLSAYRASFGGNKTTPVSRGSLLPGCTDAELARAHALGETTARAPEGRTSFATLQADTKALWQSPCFVLVARYWPLPASFANAGDLRAFLARFQRARFNLGGLPTIDEGGVRIYLAPEETPRALTELERRAVAPFTCAKPDDAGCVEARSYVARADQRFEADYWLSRRHQERDLLEHGTSFGWCADAREGEEKVPAFERWLGCARAVRASKREYTKGLALRAPTRGWLVLRGRRGHYEFSDEVRAYDLVTGAAYVASSSAGLVLSEDDAAKGVRKRDVYVGRVSVDQLRELAFVLVTAPAVVTSYPEVALVVPQGLEAAVGTGKPKPPDVRLGEWRSSNDTTLSWSIAEGGDVRAHGTITWPASPRVVETHADELIEVLEAGLVRGCTPASLPASLPLGGKARVSPIDGNASEVEEAMNDLEHALVALKAPRCVIAAP